MARAEIPKKYPSIITFSTENMDKELWKCESESISWGYITDEHGEAITLSAMERWKSGRFRRTTKEIRQFDNKKAEELELVFDNFGCG